MKSSHLWLRAALLLLPALLTASADGQATISALGSGDWGDGTTWSGGTVPGLSDTAGFGGVEINLEADHSVGGLVIGAGGVLTGTNTSLTVSGSVSINPGFANANEVLVGATNTASITVNSLGTTDVFAAANASEGLYDEGTGSAVWNNLSGGVFTLHDSAGLIGNPGSVFTNALGATFVHAGAQTGEVDWTFVNHGLLNVTGGTLNFAGTTVTSDRDISVAAGAGLQFNSTTFDTTGTVGLGSGATLGLNDATLGAGATVAGAGTVILTGTTTLGGPVTLAAGLVWTAGAGLTGTNSAMTVSGPITLNSGGANANEVLVGATNTASITVNSLGTTDVFAAANASEGLYDEGTGSAVWNNLSGGVFTLHDSAGLIGNPGSVFTNALGATFVHAGAQTGEVDWSFVNHGLLDVAGGTLNFASTTLTSDGAVSVEPEAGLQFVESTFNTTGTVSLGSGATLGLNDATLGAGATVAGAGTVILTGTTTLGGPVTLAAGLVWTAGAGLTGTNSAMTVSGPITLNSGGANANEVLVGATNTASITVNSLGTTDVFAAANASEGLYDEGTGSAVWNNLSGGVFTLHDSAGLIGNPGSVFTNAAGASFVHVGGQTSEVDWSFVNQGTLNVAGGTLVFSGSTFTGAGAVNVASGAALVLSDVTLGDGTSLVVAGGGGAVLAGQTTVAGTATLANLVWAPSATLTGPGRTFTLGGAVVLNPGAANADEVLFSSTTDSPITVNSVGTTDVFAPANTNTGLYDDGTGTALWNNLSGGVFTLHDSASLLGSSSSVFTNAAGGSFVHVGGQTAVVQWGFVNHGLINVAGGTLVFSNTTLASDGTVSAGPNATLALSDTTLADGTTLAVGGGGTAILFGTTTVAGTATLANVVWTSGAYLTGANATVTLGGAVVLNPLAANDFEHLVGGEGGITVNSVGSTDVFAPANTNVGLNDDGTGSAVWNNLSGGVFTLHDSASVLGSPDSLFTNAAGGTFVHAGGQTGVVEWSFVNHGLVDVAGGTLDFSNTAFTSDGTVNVESGATLFFDQSTLGTGSVIGGAGPTTFNTLTVAGTATISTLAWAPGTTLTGANASLTLSGTAVLDPGANNASEYLYASTNSAVITVNNTGATDVFAPANTNVGLNDDGTGSAVWNNLAGGVFTLHDSASVLGSPDSLFTNAAGGTFVHAGGQTGVVQWSFVNHGLVDVAGGTLDFSNTAFTSDGTVNVESGATLFFDQSTLGTGSMIGGAGPTTFNTLTVAGTATISTLAWAPGTTLTGANASLTLSGTAVLDPGANNASEYLYASTSSAVITVNNTGATDVFAPANTNVGLNDDGTGSAVWNNLAGGVFTLHDSASVLGSPDSLFTNAAGGTFVHAGGQTGVVEWSFVNHGLVDVAGGTLDFSNTTFTSDGTVNVESGATLFFDQSTLGTGSVIGGAGPTTFNTLTVAGTATISTLAWAPGTTLTGANASLTLSGTAVLDPGANNASEYLYASTNSAVITVNNTGATDVFAPANTNVGLNDDGTGSAVWNNLAGGVFTLHDSASVLGSPDSLFTNAAGGTLVHAGGQTGVVEWSFVNHGLVDVAGGTLDFSNTTFTSDGTVNVESGATLFFDQSTLGTGSVIGGAGPTTFNTLTVAGTATISTLAWAPGTTLTGANANLTLSGTAVLDPGANNASEYLYASTNSAVITVNNTGATDVFAPANTNVGLNDDGTGSAVWNNLAGGVFTLHDSASVLGSPDSLFTNAAGGTFVHAGGQTGVVEWSFVNHGLVDVTGGALEFANTTLASDGTVSVSPGAAVVLSGTTLAGGTTLAVGGGGNAVLVGTNTVAQTATLANVVWTAEALLTGSNATATLGASVVLNPGANNANEHLHADEGTVTVNSVGATDIFAPANTNVGLTDDGSGTAIWNNLAGAVFTLHDSASILGSDSSVFTNAVGSTFAQTGGQTGVVEWSFVNHGLVDVASGILDYSNTTFTSDGTVNVESGAVLYFDQSTLGSGSTLGGAGPVAFNTLTLAGTATISTLAWAPGANLTGANANLTLSGTAVLNPGSNNASEFLYASTSSAEVTVNNAGATDVFAPANTNVGLNDNGSGTTLWNNLAGAVFTLHDSASVLGSPGSVFTNEAGGDFVHASGQTGVVQWSFNNAGTVEVQPGGTLAFLGPVAQDDGAGSLTGGTWIADSNATLTIPGSSGFTTIGTGGAVTLNGPNSSFTALAPLSTNNGTFQLLAGGAFTTVAALANNGAITVDGAGSILNAGNSLLLGARSILAVTNGGTVNVGGTGPDNGALNILAGGTLAGVGTVNGDVILTAGGTLAAGLGGGVGVEPVGPTSVRPQFVPPGLLTINGNLTLNDGGVLEFGLGSGPTPLILTGGTLIGPDSGQVTVNLTALEGFGDGTYTLIDFSTGTALDLTGGDFALGTAPDGFDYEFAVASDALQVDVSNLTVPEPSTYAVWAGLVVLGVASLRRRLSNR